MKVLVTIVMLFIVAMAGPAVAQTKAPPASQNSQPAIDPQKEQLIRHLLDLMHVQKAMNDMMGPMLDQFTKSFQAEQMPDESMKKLSTLMNQKMTEKMRTADFMEVYVAVYDKYYATDEIKGLIAFYESPVGQKSVDVQSSLSVDLLGRLMPTVMQMSKDVESEVRKEHPELFPDKTPDGLL
jgi:uncharacterized protein